MLYGAVDFNDVVFDVTLCSHNCTTMTKRSGSITDVFQGVGYFRGPYRATSTHFISQTRNKINHESEKI